VTELRIGDQLIRFDCEATIAAYSQFQECMTDRCGCVECRNFAPQRDTIFTQGFKAFLTDLGIDYRKEAEACPEGALQDGFLRYGGWFNLSGELVDAGEGLADVAGIQCFFRRNAPNATAFFGPHVLALEFFMIGAWILSEPPSFASKRP